MKRALVCLGSLSAVTGKIYFLEKFDGGDDDWQTRWNVSGVHDIHRTGGKMRLGTGRWFLDRDEDRGMMTLQDSKNYDFSATFDQSFSNEGKDLILQYQVKYEKEVACGGGYIKIGPGKTYPEKGKTSATTPYNIMFGPDQCGYTKRTHLIFQYKGKNVLKRTDIPFYQTPIGTSHVYRMHLKPDNTVRVDIDGEKVYEGSIKDDWEVLKPKEIPKNETKPDDWVDEFVIDDPKEKKPADWVEDKRTKDLSAPTPALWNEEEDGEWHPPMKDNPAYKGEWYPKRIKNPVYKGFWEPSKISNPEFVDDDNIYKYTDNGYVGFNLWQVHSKSIFDNIIVTDDVAEADPYVEKWKKLFAHEKKEHERAEIAAEEERRRREEEEYGEDDEHEERSEEM